MAHEPFLLQLGESRPALFDLLVGDRPVDLVEVDRFHPEPREARLELAPERVSLEALHRRSIRPFGLPAFREHVRALGEARERATDDLLRVTEAVLGGRVDPVDAELEGVVDRSDRIVVVLCAPAPVVGRASERPGAEADAGDLEPGCSEFSGLDLCVLHRLLLRLGDTRTAQRVSMRRRHGKRMMMSHIPPSIMEKPKIPRGATNGEPRRASRPA